MRLINGNRTSKNVNGAAESYFLRPGGQDTDGGPQGLR
jgi:hypothetical protein